MRTQPKSVKPAGDTLVFPQRCAVHGTEAEPLFRRDEKLLFVPYWSILLIPLGLLPFLLVFVLLRREQKVTYYLSSAGQTFVLKRRLTIGILMVLAIATMAIGAMGVLWVFWLTVLTLSLAAYLYRRIFFPFRFRVDDRDAVVVYALPPSFDL